MTEAELLSKRLSQHYNCAHYLCDAWEYETGDDLRSELASFLLPPTIRTTPPSLQHNFIQLPKPTEPCVVLLRRAKAAPHVGMFIRGRILHLTDRGPVRQLLSVAKVGYTSMRFYGHRKNYR